MKKLSNGASLNPIALIASWPSTPPRIAPTGGTSIVLSAIISDSNPNLLLTSSSLRAADDSSAAKIKYLDKMWSLMH